MTKARETRCGAPIELRAADDGAGVKVSGYAAVFNQAADIGDIFKEVIAPGAFDGVLGDDVVFLINHDGLPLARTTSGTLTLSVDARGLRMETQLDPADPDAARVIPKLQRGDLSKMSFGFIVEADEWDHSGDVPVRTIRKLKTLVDVSVVTHPAFSGTDIALRSLEAARASAEGEKNSADAAARRMRMRLALPA